MATCCSSAVLLSVSGVTCCSVFVCEFCVGLGVRMALISVGGAWPWINFLARGGESRAFD